MGSMGERFVLYRLPEADADELAHRSLSHVGREVVMREELRSVVCQLFDAIPLPDPAPQLSESDAARLVTLATFTVRARSAVERDGYKREIELIPEPEVPTRLVAVLARMLSALRAIGVDEAEAWQTVQRLGLDSIPAIRRSVIEHLASQTVPAHSTWVAEACGYPRTTAERTLEDLTAHRIVTAKRYGPGKPNEWRLSDWGTSPDIPPHTRMGIKEGASEPLSTSSGISGEVAGTQLGLTAGGAS
jgi:hypothetical protein